MLTHACVQRSSNPICSPRIAKKAGPREKEKNVHRQERGKPKCRWMAMSTGKGKHVLGRGKHPRLADVETGWRERGAVENGL